MNCTDNYISVKQHLTNSTRKMGVLVGLPFFEVDSDTHELNALTCNNNHLDFAALLALCFGVDSCGDPAIRVKIIDSCEKFTTCNNNDKDPLLNQCFAYDATLKTYALVLNRSTTNS